MKTNVLKLGLLLIFSIFLFSCDGEDGMDGVQGLQGPAGMDGVNGSDGVDGANGNDGVDGNANVQTITFDASSFEGPYNDVPIQQLTQDVLENDAILTYLSTSSGNWFPVPTLANIWFFNYSVDVNLGVGLVSFDYFDGMGNSANITAGDLDSGKVVIIESTSVTPASENSEGDLSATELVLKELENANVDVNDYHAVINYYGLNNQ